MKQFLKDYNEYQKEINGLTKKWYKRHWKGTIVVNLLLIGGTLGWIFQSTIKKKVSELFSKKENVETEEES